MNCAVANITHNTFSLPSNPISPKMMAKFQPLEGTISTSNHHHNDHQLPLMKRKRPERIIVPVDDRVSGSLDVRNSSENDVVEEIEVEGDGYGVYCKRGRSRALLEDRYSALVDRVHANPKQAFFGIFDGHGGAKAAEFAAARLGNNILDNIGRGIKAKSNEVIEEKIKDGYLAVDEEFLKENPKGGTCCVTALIQDGHLMVSNVGDCRAVVSYGGLAQALTTDHCPSREDEKFRVEAKGGYVDCYNGVWRIQGSLAVSRAIGDQHFKQWITAEPDTKTLNIQPNSEFLILASDGLWNKVSNQEAVDTVLPFLTAGADKLVELTRACRKLVELSVSRGSSDDTSVMVIQLGRFAC